VDPEGRFAYVGNYGSGQQPGQTISIVDLAARKEVRRFDLGALRRPHGIAFAAGKVYFTAEANRLIGRLDPQSNQIDWLMGTGQAGTHMVLPNSDASRLVTANIGSDSITVFEHVEGPAGWNATVIPVGKGPEGLDVSPDGRQLWTAHSGDGGVSIIDLAGKKVIDRFDAGTKRSNRIKFTPDGKYVFISDLAAGELLIFDTATKKEVKRLKLGRMVEGILMARDGARAYVAVAGENHIAVIDIAKLEVLSKIQTGAGPDGMAWALSR
jgi:streptogramin lyase